MSQNITLAGNGYVIPDLGEINWGQNLTDYFVAIPSGVLQTTGGNFTLSADVNFGASFGLVSTYFKSRSANIAASGVVRLANTDSVAFRNAANSADLLLAVNGSNQLTFNGVVLESDTLPSAQMFVGNASNESTPRAISGAWTMDNVGVATLSANYIVDSMINSAAAIAYSKLALTGSIVNADINAAASIAYSKLNLAGSIVNADVNMSAAIAYSKLNLSGSIVNADINASAAIALSKLAALSVNRIVRSNGSGVLAETGWTYGTITSDWFESQASTGVYFRDSGGTNRVGISSPASVTSHSYLLPIAAGSAGQVLSWQAGGQLQWINAAGGGTINTGTAGFFAYYPATGTTIDDQTLLTVDGTTVKFTSTGGSGLRVYGGAGTNQWDVYLIGANLRFSDNTTGGVVIFDTAIHNAVGTAALPSIAFASDTDTGFYLQSTNAVSASAGGVLQAEFTPFGFGVKDGTSTNPSIYFLNGDSDTGWYRSASGEIQMVNDGALVWKWNSTGQIGTNNDAKIYTANGGAASPSHSFFNDADTGWFGLADNSMRLSLGATQRFIFDSSTLQILNDSARLSLFRTANSRQWYATILNTNGGVEYHSGNSGGSETDTIAHQFKSDAPSAGTNCMTILARGFVSIGADIAPAERLLVVGDASESLLRLRSTNTTTNTVTGIKIETGIASGGIGATPFLHFQDGGSDVFKMVGAAGLIQAKDGSAGTPQYSFLADADTGMYRSGSDILSFALAGSQRLELNGTAMTWKNAGSHAYFYVDRANTSSEGLVVFTTGAVGTNQAACGFDNDTTNSWHIFTGGDLGTPKITVDTGGTTTFVESIRQKDGTAGGPSYTFTNDTDTGFYTAGSANTIRATCGGIQQFRLDTTGLYVVNQYFGKNGTAASPTYSFDLDTDTGMYRTNTNVLAFSAAAEDQIYITDGTMQFNNGCVIRNVDGTSGSPSFSFDSDTNTGMFRQGADVIGWSCAGTQHLALTTGQLSPGATDGTMNLGSGSARWNTVFATNSTINTSHSSTKENIVDIDPLSVSIPQGVFFDRAGRRYMGYLNDDLPNEARPIENGIMLGTMNYENAVVGILCAHVRKLELEIAELKAASKFN